ncbi:hypothetical protein QQZ08_000479 [Neonectria magnoliae]|uniref:Peptidase S8/S53 domain-containing protein n=1 Tax=Neonectria magnoliae TaxID=2732573 RepID=A0ABR1IJY1_9HYPO
MTYKQVRVAVIDTGINGDDPYAKHIRGYRDFVTNKDDIKQAKTGHGTNSVNLICKVYAEPETYVARVFEHDQTNERYARSDATGNTPKKFSGSIANSRRQYNIIASGFERDHASMRKAIKSAVSDGTLVFTAAFSYGNIRQVTFPARMQNVICGHYTDGRAKVSRSINPAAQTTKSKNFAILGEGVSVPPATLTGTSVATSIAASLAGRLLDISRQRDGQQRIR